MEIMIVSAACLVWDVIGAYASYDMYNKYGAGGLSAALVIDIIFYGCSAVLAVALIFAAMSSSTGLLRTVILGLQIRFVASAVLIGWYIYRIITIRNSTPAPKFTQATKKSIIFPALMSNVKGEKPRTLRKNKDAEATEITTGVGELVVFVEIIGWLINGYVIWRIQVYADVLEGKGG